MIAQDKIKLSGIKGTLAGLIDHPLAIDRRDLGDDLPSRLTAYKDSPTGASFADPRADPLSAPQLVGWAVAQIGLVTFTGVHHVHPGSACRSQHFGGRLKARTGEIQVIPHGVDIAAGSAEVTLPVDTDQCGMAWVNPAVKRPSIRFSVNGTEHYHC